MRSKRCMSFKGLNNRGSTCLVDLSVGQLKLSVGLCCCDLSQSLLDTCCTMTSHPSLAEWQSEGGMGREDIGEERRGTGRSCLAHTPNVRCGLCMLSSGLPTFLACPGLSGSSTIPRFELHCRSGWITKCRCRSDSDQHGEMLIAPLGANKSFFQLLSSNLG